MKVLLVNPLSTPERSTSISPRIPYGIAYIAAVLEKEGYEVAVWDRNVNQENIETFLRGGKPGIIGFSVMTGPCIADAIEISRRAKTIFPRVPIVWGGVHPTLLPEQTLSEEYIDYLICGDGEYAMLDLVKTLQHNGSIKRVKGIYYKEGKKIRKTPSRPFIKDLDELPNPAWHLFDIEKYIDFTTFRLRREINLNTSRGCPFNCSFCSEPVFNKRVWRGHSSKRVIEMIEHLHSEYDIEYITFRESNFFANPKRVEEICDGLIERKMDIRWQSPARVQKWDKGMLKKMKKSGCVILEFGIESGSLRILKLFNKGITPEEIYDTLKKCKEVGILPQMNLVVGAPTETRDDFDMTVELVNNINYSLIDLMIFIPYPGSELYNLVVGQGLFKPPTRLEDWTSISDVHGFESPFGEVEKETLWKLKQLTLKMNDSRWKIFGRKCAIHDLTHNPKKAVNLAHFFVAAIRFASKKIKKRFRADH